MATTTYLVDNSALYRLRTKPPVASRLEPLILQGLAATCSVTELEQLFSARSGSEHREWLEEIALRFIRIPLEQRVFDRAIEVQGMLAQKSEHRAASIADLAVAAAAELSQLALLHYDADFDLIASVTGQSTEWVVPRGSID